MMRKVAKDPPAKAIFAISTSHEESISVYISMPISSISLFVSSACFFISFRGTTYATTTKDERKHFEQGKAKDEWGRSIRLGHAHAY